jgi:hypothetical protein
MKRRDILSSQILFYILLFGCKGGTILVEAPLINESSLKDNKLIYSTNKINTNSKMFPDVVIDNKEYSYYKISNLFEAPFVSDRAKKQWLVSEIFSPLGMISNLSAAAMLGYNLSEYANGNPTNKFIWAAGAGSFALSLVSRMVAESFALNSISLYNNDLSIAFGLQEISSMEYIRELNQHDIEHFSLYVTHHY